MAQSNAVGFKYFSEILGRTIHDHSDRKLGRVWDLVAELPSGEFPYPPVKGIVLRNKGREFYLPSIAFSPAQFESGELTTDHHPEPLDGQLSDNDFRVREVLLDKQIVDVDGAKVERVNDVHMLISDRPWIVHVDVGLTGLLRRLGFESSVRRLTRGILRREMRDDLVNWKVVQPLAETEGTGAIRLKVEQAQMKQLHPGEMADILEDLDRDEQMAVVRTLSVEDAADVLEETEEDVQKKVFSHLEPETAADIIEQMDPAEAVDILSQLHSEQSQQIIAAMQPAEREQIQELIQYNERSAGGLMTNEFIRLHPRATVGQALDELRTLAGEIDMIFYIYMVDGAGRLTGVVTLRELLTSGRDQALNKLMSTRLVAVEPGTSVRKVAETFQKYSFLACPVLDGGGRILGVIDLRNSFDDLLPYFDKDAA
ncbi:MAG: CBS domain-containing protein [Candidatus Alcyoniella australis]|nr:CBS domain-containing protein [Candidatus Alcyoniella australis]